ncbi:Guanylate cyclase soluble subunit beta-1 [Hypsibius exemplaris]|uniref:Guanylate cyclase soluble subunit beta-1 n=1 Tax=Hypsibius exemplaris TaxID=2072580 RepID=A0A9X6RM87_HYPEX|nr:Guanylate cyclase soluble subunit beta-1 [Hypsibius exemplaris]
MVSLSEGTPKVLALGHLFSSLDPACRAQAGVDLDGGFLIRQIYPDAVTVRLAVAAEAVLGVKLDAILELFGAFFFDFCVESGYEPILRVLGSSPIAFLENLDALHDHLGSIYPGMRAPSFRCERRDPKSTILHYYSERTGFEPIVIGIVKAVARKIHRREISIQLHVRKNSAVPGCDHSQFIIEEADPDTPGSTHNLLPQVAGTFEGHGPKLSPETFATLFPFHILFDSMLLVRGFGMSLAKVLQGAISTGSHLRNVFKLVRPRAELNFDLIMSHLMTVFVMEASTSSSSQATAKLSRLKLKGQIIHLSSSNLLLFICSPVASSLQQLSLSGVSLSDIPLHDAAHDLVVLAEQFAADYAQARELEILTDQLRQTFRDLEAEKARTDRLLYSVLPASVANELRLGRPVLPMKHDSVTVMFCGVSNFAEICERFADKPIKMVETLNGLFSRFDALTTDPKRSSHVYKVESIGEKYLVASGLPEREASHARWIAQLSLDMMTAARLSNDITDLIGFPITVTIGVHSGELVTGVIGHTTPRYCLFGNTVNLASRTESFGRKGCINITDFTYELLQVEPNTDESFQLELYADVFMKGRSEPMRLYNLSNTDGKVADVERLISQRRFLAIEDIMCCCRKALVNQVSP